MENLKLYEPSMLDQETKEQVLPTIEDLSPESQVELEKVTFLQKKSKTTSRQWQHDLWQIGLKGQLLGKEK
jgi:hypothetical protein